MKPLPILLCALFAAGGFAEGLRAWREGRYDAALAAFTAALAEAGARPPAVLHYDQALAALRADELDLAARAADAAAAGDPRFAARRDFLHGCVAFHRSELAEAEANGPVPPAGALERAIGHAEAARLAWQAAAASRADWPEARRNVERALRRLAALRARRDTERAAPPEQMRLPDRPEPRRDARAQPPEPPSAEQIQSLLDRLEQHERARAAARRGGALAPGAAVRDW